MLKYLGFVNKLAGHVIFFIYLTSGSIHVSACERSLSVKDTLAHPRVFFIYTVLQDAFFIRKIEVLRILNY